MKELRFATEELVKECYTSSFKKYNSPWEHLYEVEVRRVNDGFRVDCYVVDEMKHLVRLFTDFEVLDLNDKDFGVHQYRTELWREFCVKKYGRVYIQACADYYARKTRESVIQKLEHFICESEK